MTSARRPNVVLVVADDMGYGDVALFNGGRSSTPNLDGLASDGVCLTQCYSGSPVCSPSRASLLTGRYPQRTGAIDTLHGRGLDRIALSEVTLADVFHAAGYRTGLIGKWHNGALDPRFHPNARGFEEFVGFSGGFSDYYDYVLDINGSDAPGDGRYLTDVITENAVSFVRRHAAEAFFLVVAYNAPHFPMQAPEHLVERYEARGETTGAALTYAMIEVLDEGIGRIVTALGEEGVEDDTIFVFVSDNGPYLGEVAGVSLDRFNYGLRGAKHYVFEGGIRVPAIVRWPAGLDGGRTVAEMVHFTDWLPTLAAAAGADAVGDRELDGRDVFPVLAGVSPDVEPRRFWQCNRYEPRIEGNAAMRDGNWKLVRPAIPEHMLVFERDRAIDRALNGRLADRITVVDDSRLPVAEAGSSSAPLLFDLAADPFEESDVAALYPDRVARMSLELEWWFESVERDRARSRADGQRV